MANVKISALPTASTPLTGAELVPIVQSGVTSQTTVDNLLNPLAETNGSSLVAYLPSGTGAVATTVQAKLRETVSVKDFGAVGDGVTDDTNAIKNAIAYAETATNFVTYGSNSPAGAPISVFFPCGYYKITSAIVITAPVTLVGEGASEFSSGARIYQDNKDADVITVNPQSSGMSFGMYNMTLRHNNDNTRNGTGILVRVNKTTAYCNSQRYIGCTFGQPAYSYARLIGDDILFDKCLFDVSYGKGLELGTITSGEIASNVRINGCDFFDSHINSISIYNAKNVVVSGCTAYHDVSKSIYFIDAYNTVPVLVDNVSVTGNSISQIRTIAALKNATNCSFTGNTFKNLGKGPAETQNAFEMYGTCSNIVISSNTLSGSYDNSHFYTDASSTAVNTANISGNSFYNTAGGGAALICAKTTGVIANNAFTGFATPSISESFTTGTIFSGGNTLTAGSADGYSTSVTGSKSGDKISINYLSTANTTGSINSGSSTLTVAFPNGIVNGATITIAGAGASGADLTTTVSSGGGTVTLTLAASASTTVSSAAITFTASLPYDLGIINNANILSSGACNITYTNPTASTKYVYGHKLQLTISRGM